MAAVRRGRRGPNKGTEKPKVSPARAKPKKDIDAAVERFRKHCKFKSPAAMDAMVSVYETSLKEQAYLEARIEDQTITSEEGAVLNSTNRNILKCLDMAKMTEVADDDEDDLI